MPCRSTRSSVTGPWLAGLSLSLLVLMPLAAWAASPDPYAGQALVADEGPKARAEGLRRILRQVVLRLAARRDVLRHPALDGVLDQASDLVQQFRYEAAPAGEGRLLWARFDPDALSRLLVGKGIPVWRGPRPRVLLWLAEEQGVQRRLLNPSEDTRLRTVLSGIARDLGMRLQLPLMDLEDQAALSPADLWADYAAAIERASARYPHDLVLTARLRRLEDGSWASEWSLWEGQEAVSFSARGDARAAVVAAGLEQALALLAARRQPDLDAGGEAIRLRIEGVENLEAYGRLMQALRAKDTVRDVRLRAADGHDLVLVVRAASRDLLRRTLARMPMLRPLPGGDPEGDGLAAIEVEQVYLFTGDGG